MANLRTLSYPGFEAASSSLGPGGWMFWSGSKTLTGSGAASGKDTTYAGVGLEAVNNSESYFRYSASAAGSGLDVRTNSFFLGSTDSFISGSGDGTIAISSSYFELTNLGTVTMQGTITATAGAIGGATIDDDSLAFSPYWRISASNAATDPVSFISSSGFKVSADGRITGSEVLLGDKGGGNYLQFAGSTLTVQGTITADNIRTPSSIDGAPSTVLNASSSINSDGYARFASGSIAGWEIASTRLVSPNDRLELDVEGGTNQIKIAKTSVAADGADYVRMYYSDVNNFGIQGKDGGSQIFHLGSDNEIAGWTFDDEKLTGGNMIINKDGTIESDGFVSNLAGSGFRLTAASGGFLEVENARIRGTLSTAVFEKESVNAVGGQLYVANSTIITGSTFATLTSGIEEPSGYTSSAYPPTETTISCVNVSGFAEGEIISAKRITTTGFSTEYMKIESSSRFAADENDLTGAIYVERGLGTSYTGVSGSLGDSGSAAQSYTGSQVIVSTGKLGTGYVRINANPNDPYTPYIDIVERTGSEVYDVDLKARLGDLSGITDYSFSDGVTGYGLYTGNGYFKGKIEVSSIASPPAASKLVHHYKFNGVSGSQFLSASNAAFRNDGTGDNKSPVSASGYYNSTPNTDPVSQSYYTDGVFGTAALIKCRPESFRFKDHPAKFGPVNNNSGSISWWQRVEKFDNYSTIDNAMGGGFGYNADSYDSFIEVGYNKLRCQDTDGDWYALYNPIDPETGVYAINHTASTENGNTWNHFVVNFTGTGMELYRNGVKGTGADWGDASDGIVFDRIGHAYGQNIGQAPWPTSSFDDVRIYDSVLTENEVQGLYTNADGGGTIIDGGRISTGKIESTNWAASAGSELDLDAGTFKLGGSTNSPFSWDGTDLNISGSSVTLEAPTFFMGDSGTQFISGSNNQIEISSSQFHLQTDGSITASAALITGDITVTGGGATGSISDFPSNAGLIGYYPLHDSPVSPAGYKRILDYSGQDNHSTDAAEDLGVFVSGSAAGPLMGAMTFNGTDTQASFGDISDYNFVPSGSFAISFWVKHDTSTATEYSSLVSKYGLGSKGFDFVLNNGHPTFYVRGTTNLGLAEAVNIRDDAWHHLAVTCEAPIAGGVVLKLYRNGEQKASTTGTWTATVSDQGFKIGERNTGGPAFHTGEMGEVRLYTGSAALTADNIRALYNSPSGPPTSTMISGDKISTGKIQSSNWAAATGSQIDLDAGTIKMGGSSNPAFDVTSTGLVTATNFGRNTVTVLADGTNLANYAKSVAGGVNLVFDGSEGGDICMHMILKKHPGDLIKGFDLPQSATGLDCTVTVDVQVTGVKFDDATIAPDLLAMNEFVAPP